MARIWKIRLISASHRLNGRHLAECCGRQGTAMGEVIAPTVEADDRAIKRVVAPSGTSADRGALLRRRF
ncbi:MAG: hypothetical protein P4L98_20760 [Ancalomicrobiaceae bacterium]|nr:hypothetical protein [Ancalomicrobiaceae bacterium]